ncbi:MAG: LON peptidase substrate-binding domain-containing protein [Nocardioidaceae bacterium]
MSNPLPLFPLNTVLFPGVVMPLHIFEDRYRSLVRDLIALPPDADREFGVVAINVGYEAGDRGVHTIQRTGCAALVTEVTANPDGTFEIIAVGRRRFHVERLDPSQDYLCADVEWLADGAGTQTGDAGEAARTAVELFEVYRDTIEELRGDDILAGEAPRDPIDLSYTLAASLMVNLADRQSLLECPDVASRLSLGIALMRAELRAIHAIPSLPATMMARTQWCPN